MRRFDCSGRVAVAVLCLPFLFSAGCQSGFRKPTHAAQRCLSSDPRYRPAGPEFRLENQTKALEEYKLECEARRAALAQDDQ